MISSAAFDPKQLESKVNLFWDAATRKIGHHLIKSGPSTAVLNFWSRLRANHELRLSSLADKANGGPASGPEIEG